MYTLHKNKSRKILLHAKNGTLNKNLFTVKIQMKNTLYCKTQRSTKYIV